MLLAIGEILVYARILQPSTSALVSNLPEGKRSMSRSVFNTLWNCSEVTARPLVRNAGWSGWKICTLALWMLVG